MSKIEMVKGKALTSLITSIGKSAAAIKHNINVACHSAALHVLEHGNTTPINDLCEVARDITHNNAVNRWFNEYCPWIRWDSKEKSFVLKAEVRKAVLDDNGKVDPEVVDEYIGTLEAAKSYLEFTPAPKFNGVSVIGMLKAIQSKVEKAQAEADEMEAVNPEEAAVMRSKIDVKGLNEVTALLGKLAA